MTTPQPSRAAAHNTSNPQECARRLGTLIRNARNRDGRPLDELVDLAGLTESEWMEIEAGEKTCASERILIIGYWILHCSPAWLEHAQSLCPPRKTRRIARSRVHRIK